MTIRITFEVEIDPIDYRETELKDQIKEELLNGDLLYSYDATNIKVDEV